MQLRSILIMAVIASAGYAHAQNTSPYWSMAGNSNTTTSSKLGTTNAIALRLMTNNTARIYISPSAGLVGIGTTAPLSSALLEVKSTTRGVLFPRMTLIQRNAIVSPATGLLIYQIDNTPGFYYYNSGWKALSGSSAASSWSLNGNSGTTASNFIGTTDAHPLQFKVNGQKSGFIDYGAPYRTSYGYQALKSLPSGEGNTALGFQALYSDSTGSNNTAVGIQAL